MLRTKFGYIWWSGSRKEVLKQKRKRMTETGDQKKLN